MGSRRHRGRRQPTRQRERGNPPDWEARHVRPAKLPLSAPAGASDPTARASLLVSPAGTGTSHRGHRVSGGGSRLNNPRMNPIASPPALAAWRPAHRAYAGPPRGEWGVLPIGRFEHRSNPWARVPCPAAARADGPTPRPTAGWRPPARARSRHGAGSGHRSARDTGDRRPCAAPLQPALAGDPRLGDLLRPPTREPAGPAGPGARADRARGDRPQPGRAARAGRRPATAGRGLPAGRRHHPAAGHRRRRPAVQRRRATPRSRRPSPEPGVARRAPEDSPDSCVALRGALAPSALRP